jgi:hypothetical protein
MTGCASSQKIVRASINRYKNFNKLKNYCQTEGIYRHNAGAILLLRLNQT